MVILLKLKNENNLIWSYNKHLETGCPEKMHDSTQTANTWNGSSVTG